jgi:hypothetical protein
MTINEYSLLLDEFLERWTLDEVKKMKLPDYVGVRNKDTFCQWVETKTRILGSIKGMTSIKFGIYERKDPKQKPKKYKNDNKYSWLSGYGNNREAAFEHTKKDIITTIILAGIGKFDSIDEIKLPDLFKWKVAFLYSNERLIPIFKREVLFRIANHYGFKTTSKTKISEIHNLMIMNKPAQLDVYSFMHQLYNQFGQKKQSISKKGKTKRTTRKPSFKKNTSAQSRTVARSFIVIQKHNLIQEKLKEDLIKKFGIQNVLIEENFVDIKLIQPKYISFYEVKSSSYACECIKEALGQILLYSHNDTDPRPKKHIIVGQYPPTDNEKEYIIFLKENLKLDFQYINVSLD